MDRRNTIQRSLVLSTVRNLMNHATANEVYEAIVKDYPNIGKGTVYRNLNILSEDGEIKKLVVPGAAERFEHNLKDHYHVRCIKCNRLYDVDMEVLPDLISNIHDTHGIAYIDYNVMFNGICPVCQ